MTKESRIADSYVKLKEDDAWIPMQFDVPATVTVKGHVVVDTITKVASFKITKATAKITKPEPEPATVFNISTKDNESAEDILAKITKYLDHVGTKDV
jgi:hypothetical protein